VYIAGHDDYYSEMLDCAGGQNAYAGTTIRYPTVSPEAVMHINPEVIIDLVDGLNQTKDSSESTLSDWQQLAGVAAVKSRRVYAFDKSATVPGTKIIKTIEDLARVLHPEIAWNAP